MSPLSRLKPSLLLLSAALPLISMQAAAGPWDSLKESISRKAGSGKKAEASREELWVQREMKEFAALNSLYKKSGDPEMHDKAEARTVSLIRKLRGVYSFLNVKMGKDTPKAEISLEDLKPCHTAHRVQRLELYKNFLRASRKFVKRSRTDLLKVQAVSCILRTHLYDDFETSPARAVTKAEAATLWGRKEVQELDRLIDLYPDCKDEGVLVEAIALTEKILDSYAPLYPKIHPLVPYRTYDSEKAVFGVPLTTSDLKAAHDAQKGARATLYKKFLLNKNLFNRYAPMYTEYLKAIETILLTHQEKTAAAERSDFTRKRAMHFGR